MIAYNFKYDGIELSSKGYMLCDFNPTSGTETIQNGANLTFNKVSRRQGTLHSITSSKYDDSLTTSLNICKNTCNGESPEITVEEFRELERWLNRDDFHEFRIMDNVQYSDFFFRATFNLSRVEYNGVIIGAELQMFTDAPFAWGDEISITINNATANGTHTLTSQSDDEGFICPNLVQIHCKQAGEIRIQNSTDNRVTSIKSCLSDEIITFNGKIINTSVSNHQIQNDFNWNFLRINTSYRNKDNILTMNIPMDITIKYNPIIKITI